MEDKDRDYLFEIGGQINSMYLATHRSEDHLSSISHGIEEIKKEIYEIQNTIKAYMTSETHIANLSNLRMSTVYLQIITAVMLPIIAVLLLIIVFKI